MTLHENKVRYSADGYNNVQLLGIIIGGSNGEEKAKSLLEANNNLLLNVSRMTFTALRKYLTEGESRKVMATLSLKKRMEYETNEPEKIRSSFDAYNAMSYLLEDLDHEQFWIMYLNRSNNIIEKVKTSQGGISGTVIDVRIILKKGIELLASSIILCHNHPSENNNPSQADISITRKIADACKLVDMTVLDHIIIAGNKYYSFADNGNL